MTLDQALVVYVTGMALTLCYLGITSRLPGQETFEEKTRWLAREQIAEMLAADPNDPDVDEVAILALARRAEMLLVIPGLLIIWPIYWLLNITLTTYGLLTSERSAD